MTRTATTKRGRKATTTDRRLRAVGYIRASVKREGMITPEVQEDGIAKTCEAKGYDLVAVKSDLGRSGGEGKKRPGLDEARAMIARGEADVLVAYKLDRLARSVLDFADLWAELSAAGAGFVSVKESFDTSTPMGLAMLQITMVFAELERNTIMLRAADAAEYRRDQGLAPGGSAPYGYRRDGCNLTPHDDEAEVVRRMVAHILAGGSIRSLVKQLNDERVPPSERVVAEAEARGDRAEWGYVTVRKMLGSPIMAGLRPDPETGEMVHGKWTAIVDPGDWRRMRAILDDPARTLIREARATTLLSGILRCGRCGDGMRPKNTRFGVRYRCNNGTACTGTSILGADAEPWVLEQLWKVLDAKGLRPVKVELTSDLDSEAAKLHAELDELTRLYETRELELTEYMSFRRAAQAQLSKVEGAREVERRDSAIVDLLGRGGSVRELWEADELTIDTKRAVIREALGNITVRDNGKRGVRQPAADRLEVAGR